MARQLNLDRDKLDACYQVSGQIVSFASKYIDRHSSPAVERTTLMLLGVEGEYRGEHLASLVVRSLTKDQLRLGAAYWWGRALLSPFGEKENPKNLAEKLGRGKIKWSEIPEVSPQEIKKRVEFLASEQFKKLDDIQGQARKSTIEERSAQPHLAVRVEEEKIRKIPSRVETLLKNGAPFCAVSFPFKPFHADQWGAGDLETAAKYLKPEQTVWGTAGLSLPEQVVFAMSKGFHSVLLDGWAQTLKGHVDPKRALVDQSFALSLSGRWNVLVLNDPSVSGMSPPQLLATLLLYEQHAKRQGVPFENIMLEYFPQSLEKPKGLFAQIALAQIIREAFSQSILWMGFENLKDPFFPWVAAFTEHDVLELKNPDEAALKSVKHILQETEGFANEFSLNTYGKIAREAHQILDQSWKFLKELQHLTLWKAFEENALAPKTEGGRSGGEAVFQKSFHYLNPVSVILSAREESRDPSAKASG